MRLITAITTYNRVDYLRQTVETWNATRNRNHNWSLVIADDGSDDGTLDYIASLHIPGVELHVLYHHRRGVHHQTNEVFRLCEKLTFDLAFKTDDDLIYRKAGWDDVYLQAVQASGYDHLVFHDIAWGPQRRRVSPPIPHSSGLLECVSREVQGAFWTFTARVLEHVGYFDLAQFGLCGLGHTDFTYRCCRAGFNVLAHPFDLRGSNEYLRLVPRANYREAPSKNRWLLNRGPAMARKIHSLRAPRVYVPYNTAALDLDGNAVHSQTPSANDGLQDT